MSDVVVKTRDEWIDYWLKCYQNHLTASDPNLTVDVGPGSYPYIRACAAADVLMVQSSNALAVSDSIPLDNMTLEQMRAKYGDAVAYNDETYASGYVTITTGTVGATYTNGQILSYSDTGNTYKFTGTTGVYLTGVQLPVSSVDPGIGQNLAAGSVLQWVSPPSGSYASVTVFAGPDGGITGGRAPESAEEYRERIREHNASPTGHGNEGDVMALVELSSQHGVPVEKCWTYPAVIGPGSVGYAFTVKRDNYWESRAPTSAQMTTIEEFLADAKLPGDYSRWAEIIEEEGTKADLTVTLDPRSAQWADYSPFPIYQARASGRLVVTAASSATSFTVGLEGGTGTANGTPSPGNTIAVYDAAAGVFRKKRIQTVGGSGPWTITCYSTLDQSDLTFTPVVGCSVSPWFDAINDVAASWGKQMAKLGPGEMTATVSPDGTRQMRQPAPYPGAWDDAITDAMAHQVTLDVNVVQSCSLEEATVTRSTVGDTASVNLLVTTDLAIFKA